MSVQLTTKSHEANPCLLDKFCNYIDIDDNHENALMLIREIARLGYLTDAGFGIENVKFNEDDDPSIRSINYSLCGDLSVVKSNLQRS